VSAAGCGRWVQPPLVLADLIPADQRIVERGRSSRGRVRLVAHRRVLDRTNIEMPPGRDYSRPRAALSDDSAGDRNRPRRSSS
jgi:hypothetical protein